MKHLLTTAFILLILTPTFCRCQEIDPIDTLSGFKGIRLGQNISNYISSTDGQKHKLDDEAFYIVNNPIVKKVGDINLEAVSLFCFNDTIRKISILADVNSGYELFMAMVKKFGPPPNNGELNTVFSWNNENLSLNARKGLKGWIFTYEDRKFYDSKFFAGQDKATNDF